MADSRRDPRIFLLDPDERGVLPLDDFHVPRRLARTVRQDRFDIRVDADFIGVVQDCAAPAAERTETWINDRIIALYADLHRRGDAHSVEAWRDGERVGGLYGVRLGAAFFGESMFSKDRDASKVALVHLVARLIKGGFRLLDTQFITEHLRQFGAIQISRDDYRRRLAAAIALTARFDGADLNLSGAEALQLLQSSGQTS